ncbi:MAG: hypothetical protein Kow0092_29540 [Deferrisomatales bacterium]
MAQELYGEALRLAQPQRWCQEVPRARFCRLFHLYVARSRSIAELLEGAESVWLLAATLGPDLELRVRQYLDERRVLRSHLLDRIGSHLVEEEVRDLDRFVTQQCAARGGWTTRRFSPGYGDFPLQAQEVFCGLARETLPELELTEGGLVVPEKTVTAVKGAFQP